MAFTADTFLPLSSMANSNAPRHYSYTTPDPKSLLVIDGYFDDAAKTLGLKQFDLIWSVDDNATTETFTLYFVNKITDGLVDLKSSSLVLT